MSKPVFDDLLTFSGRRNRQSYALYLVVASTLTLAALFPAAGLPQDSNRSEAAFAILSLCLLVPLTLSGLAVSAQRCRDFGWTGWAALLTLAPFAGVLFSLAILFVPGTAGANRYGPDPLQATRTPGHAKATHRTDTPLPG